MQKLLYILYLLPLLLFAHVESSVDYYEDTTNAMSIEDMLALQERDYEKLLSQNSGFSNSAYWLKVRVKSPNPVVLEFLDSGLDSVWLYKGEAEKGKLLSKVGDILPFTNRKYNDLNLAFTLLPEKTYYLKFHSKRRMTLQHTMWEDESSYLTHLQTKNLFKAFFFGALLIMLVYNIVIYLFLRERVFLEYVVYHIAFLNTMIYYTGLYGQLFFPNKPDLDFGTVSIHISTLTTMMAVQFFRSFLNTKRVVPKVDRLLVAFIVLHAFLGFLDLVDVAYYYNQIIFNLTMVLMSAFLLGVALYIAIVKRNKTGYFYFFGWFMMMLGVSSTALTMMNIIPRNEFTSNIFQVGALFEVTLLSMGLAYRYKLKQEDLAKKNIIIQKQAKLVSMGEMLQNISHQWRQPLSEINAVMMKIDADFYKKRLTSDSLEEDITKVEMLTRHMSETISSFNNYLKVNSQNSDTLVNLEEIVKQAIRILDTRLKDIQVEVEAEKLESMQLNSSDLIQVLHVLLANAVDTFESRDKASKIITIRLKKRDEKVLIEVEDNAGGVESKNLEKIFEPYFTTKFQSDGIGIGLYMARMLVENSLGGQIYVQNTKTGAKFSIEI